MRGKIGWKVNFIKESLHDCPFHSFSYHNKLPWYHTYMTIISNNWYINLPDPMIKGILSNNILTANQFVTPPAKPNNLFFQFSTKNHSFYTQRQGYNRQPPHLLKQQEIILFRCGEYDNIYLIKHSESSVQSTKKTWKWGI